MTEIHFWFLAGLMLLGSVFLFVLPMIKKAKQETSEKISRDELNKAFYRERIAELEEEAKEGLVENQDELALELKQSLLDDIPKTQPHELQSTVLMPLTAGIILFIGIVFGVYFFVGNVEKVTYWQETAARLPALSARMMADQQDPMSDQEMADMILALRTQLQKTPDDAMGWLLLGRIALANRDIATAEGAMAKSYRLMPQDSDVILGYAQSLMLTGDEVNADTARNLLNTLVKQNHGDIQALSLLAFDAFEQGAYAKAKEAWSTMKQFLNETDPRHKMLDRSIAKVDSLLNKDQTHAQSVNVIISIAPDVVLPTDGVLFISAHSADGAPMPIAAKRLPLPQFPIEIELTDADSMIPERLLSSQRDLMLKARIDLDGDLITKEGFYGESQPISLGGETEIQIKK